MLLKILLILAIPLILLFYGMGKTIGFLCDVGKHCCGSRLPYSLRQYCLCECLYCLFQCFGTLILIPLGISISAVAGGVLAAVGTIPLLLI